MSTLVERRDRLYMRLEVGWQKVDALEKQGKDVTTLEDFWLVLLAEYEGVCRELNRRLAD
jgi:hypothetical protein